MSNLVVKVHCDLTKHILSFFFQWNKLSGSDITDAKAATLISLGAAVVVF